MDIKEALSVEGGAIKFIRHSHGIKHIVVPDTVKIIAKEAFRLDSTAESIMLPSSVVRIEKSAFEKCSALKKIYIPCSVEIIEEDAFKDCPNLEIYLEGEPQAGWADGVVVRTVKEQCITPEDDAFNFHRSSGGWSYTTYEREEKVKVCWNPDNRKVFTNVKRENF